MTDLSRRGFLGAAAAGTAASLLPPSVHEALARPMPRGGLDAIEHVVVLMQENRSFDHYYGSLRGVRGFGDRHPLPRRAGGTVLEQPGGAGHVLPFSLREAAERAGRPDGDIEYLGALAHGFSDATAAWARGWYDAWVPAKTAATMTYYERRDLPLQYELAETFTICDAYHCSVFGSTNPNRNYLMTGTTGFEPGTTERAVTNAAYDYDHPGYDWTTYPERLERAGVSWRIYQEWDNFTDNAVEYFAPFKAVGSRVLREVGGPWRTTEELYFAMLEMSPAQQQQALAGLERGRRTLTDAERRLFDLAVFRSEPGTLVDRVAADIRRGTLPKVSWVVPTAADSEHPSSSTPVGSAHLVYRLLDAIASDRRTWESTALLIDFDENDGYFDHVPPPVAPRPASGNGPDWYDGRPIGLGPRVPMTVVSPWTVGGHVASEVFDHTSVIRLLERCTGVREPNISAWRRSVCGDLTSTFDFTRAGRPPRLERPGPVPAAVDRWSPTPPAEQAPPRQERGRRPSRAVPYEPSVGVRVEGHEVLVDLRDDGSRAAPFAVYPYADELAEPLHRDVTGSALVRVRPPAPSYRLVVQGPDRFWAELSGRLDGAGAGLEVRTEPAGHRLRVVLANRGEGPLEVRVAPAGHPALRVRLAPGQRRARTVPTDHGWYDVRVGVAEDDDLARRVAGRVGGTRPGLTP